MRKKKEVDLIFSNDEFLMNSYSTRGNRKKSQFSKKSKPSVKNFQFRYNFKEYLMLSLAKVLPREKNNITFIPEHGRIVGEQIPCKQLIRRVLNQFQTMKFTTINFFDDYDIDRIEYWLDSGATIYRPGVIEVALKQLQKYQFFKEDCEDFSNHLQLNHIIFLRVPRESQAQALETITKILREHQAALKAQHNNTTIQQGLSMTQFSSLSNRQHSASIIRDVTFDSGLSEIESSYQINQDESSLDNHCIYYNQQVLMPDEHQRAQK